MATSEGLPETLSEYLEVWCADLLEPLNPYQRRSFINGAHMMYEGGPWPERLDIQRLVEITCGIITPDAAIGEMLEDHGGGVDGALARLRNPDLRAAAIIQLGQLQPTAELISKVTEAHEHGELSSTERAAILARALRHPHLPEPLPAPAHLPPIPENYPESSEEWERRNPARALAEVSVGDAGLEAGGDLGDGGDISFRAGRELWSSLDTGTRNGATKAALARDDNADEFLRERGWRSRRDVGAGNHPHDEWTWPASEEEPWWQPTVIDFDGSKFRVRLASTSLIDPQHTDFLPDLESLTMEIQSIESWSDIEPPR